MSGISAFFSSCPEGEGQGQLGGGCAEVGASLGAAGALFQLGWGS